jgi:hypothetical protein
MDNLSRFANFLPILPNAILGELKQGGLGLGPNQM